MKISIILIVSTFFIACDFSEHTNTWNENLNVEYVMKLPSADKKSNLFSYYVKAKNEEYGSTWFTILSNDKKFAPFGEHFTLENRTAGFNILGWTGDTVKAICILTDTQPKDLQPFRREVKKWQHWYLDVGYYFANSFGAVTPYQVDTFKIKEDAITFFGSRTVLGKNQKYELTALKGQVQIPLGDTTIRVNKLETDMNYVRLDQAGKTLTHQPQVSIGSYELTTTKRIDWTKLKECGVFVEERLN